jgi:hypothetical protein
MVDSVETVKELFSKCEEQEKATATTKPWNLLIELCVQEVAFPPLFKAVADPDTIPNHDQFALQLARIALPGVQYRYLVEELTNAADAESRWFVLARWLKGEKICQPKDFLPSAIYRKLTKALRERFRRFNPSDLRYHSLVESWRPYFKRLMIDVHEISAINQRPKAALLEAGYDEDAVVIMMDILTRDRKRRSPVPVICEWLEGRGFGNARTIEKAHSRVNVVVVRLHPKISEPSL